MPLVSSALKSLIDGVSQQPDALRLQTQGDVQINGLSSEVDGLRKRPPTEFLGHLEDAEDWRDAYKFIIERDEQNKFICMIRPDPDVDDNGFGNPIRNNSVRIYDLEGNRQKVGYKAYHGSPSNFAEFDETGILTSGSGTGDNMFEAYLSHYDSGDSRTTGEFLRPSDMYRHQTIGDYTFVTNRNRVPALEDNLSFFDGYPKDAGDVIAFAAIKQSFLGQEFRLTIDDGSTWIYGFVQVSETEHLTVNEIAQGIATAIQGNGNYAAFPYAVEAVDNLILVTRKASDTIENATTQRNAFSISADGPAGTAGMIAIKETVPKFSLLPEEAPQGYVVKVAGLDNTEANDFYVKYEPEVSGTLAPNELRRGRWVETRQQRLSNRIHKETMPMAIVYFKDEDRFIFTPIQWDIREVGDYDSCPAPSFLGSYLEQQTAIETGTYSGSPIMDIVFYQSRLGFISKENIVFSESANYFDFFNTTATEVLDTDPIDVSASHSKIVNLHSIRTFNRSLVVIGDEAQFRLIHGDTLTPQSVSLQPTTEYASPNRAKPVHTGISLLYPTERGRWSGVNEMFLTDDGEQDVVADISNHVPRYIEGRTVHMDASPKEGLMALLTEGSDSVYIYKYFYSGREKLQSSWSEWQFHFTPKVALFENESMYLVGEESGVLKLYRMNLERELLEYNLPYQVHLDATEVVQGVFDGTHTTWTLDTDCTQGTVIGVILDELDDDFGYSFNLVEVLDASTVRVLGDYSSVPHVFGKEYSFRYQFSKLYYRDAEGLPIATGRLQLRRGTITHGRSGHFKVIVENSYGVPVEVEYTGRVVDDPFPDQVSVRGGVFDFPFIGRSDLANLTVESSSHLPTSIIELEWEGFYHRRNQRI